MRTNFDHIPETLTGAIRYFTKPKDAMIFMVAMRWPKGVRCPNCDSKDVGGPCRSNGEQRQSFEGSSPRLELQKLPEAIQR